MYELESNEHRAGFFRTTHWSVVLEAGGSTERERALELLCRTYWYPLYAFVRRRGYSPHEAQDLTQEFFLRLLEGRTLETAHPDKGRFRGFLVAAMKHFLANEWRDARRLKRGGGCRFLSWEELKPEDLYGMEPEADTSPEATYDRAWAETVAARALEVLRIEMEREGNGVRFETLKAYLECDAAAGAYSTAAARLSLSESAVKSAIFRMRRRYSDLVRSEIAQTVQNEGDIEEEIRRLIELLSA